MSEASPTLAYVCLYMVRPQSECVHEGGVTELAHSDLDFPSKVPLVTLLRLILFIQLPSIFLAINALQVGA